MRIANAELPKPGYERLYDRRTGIERILDILSKGNNGFIITIQSVASGLVGRLSNPQVLKKDDGYSIVGRTTATPGQDSEFRFYTDGHIPPGEELRTINSIFVRCR